MCTTGSRPSAHGTISASPAARSTICPTSSGRLPRSKRRPLLQTRRSASSICGKHKGMFPIDVFQGGGSTSTNMNVNEVIAKRANELLTGHKGYDAVHPNTHVNRGQSTNDVIPSAIGITCYHYAQKLRPPLAAFAASLKRKSEEFKDVVKASRTCIHDAVPITPGQEFSGYHALAERHLALLDEMLAKPLELPLGATASGTGFGSFDGLQQGMSTSAYRRTSRALRRALERLQPTCASCRRGRAAVLGRFVCRPCSRSPRSCRARSIR